MDILEIQKRNYEATVKRGLITSKTSFYGFVEKIDEELEELSQFTSEENKREELADIVIVCLNMAKHFDIDLIHEMELKTLKNESRV